MLLCCIICYTTLHCPILWVYIISYCIKYYSLLYDNIYQISWLVYIIIRRIITISFCHIFLINLTAAIDLLPPLWERGLFTSRNSHCLGDFISLIPLFFSFFLFMCFYLMILAMWFRRDVSFVNVRIHFIFIWMFVWFVIVIFHSWRWFRLTTSTYRRKSLTKAKQNLGFIPPSSFLNPAFIMSAHEKPAARQDNTTTAHERTRPRSLDLNELQGRLRWVAFGGYFHQAFVVGEGWRESIFPQTFITDGGKRFPRH